MQQMLPIFCHLVAHIADSGCGKENNDLGWMADLLVAHVKCITSDRFYSMTAEHL